jgi:hypothetical protein
MREDGIPQFTVDLTTRWESSTCSASASPQSSASPTCSPRPPRRYPAARTVDRLIVIAGARFENGKLVEVPDESGGDAQAA